ncbi:MAG: peptidyl-prolyl cis-trans isomerase SurA [Myxococcales bacterium]|nr:peptidyl-prolyl cis-trans isomerase SurA [Myxococcales bacterium]
MQAMHRSVVVLVAAALVAHGGGSIAGAEEPRTRLARAPVPLDGIAAIVDDVFVFRSEIDAQARRFESKLSHDPVQRRAELAMMQKELLARAIDAILIERDCKHLHLEATDAEVSAGIESVAQANGFTRKQLESEVAKAGYSQADYQEEIRRQILEQRWLMARAAGKIDRKKNPDAASFQAAIEKQREALLVDLRSHAFIELR